MEIEHFKRIEDGVEIWRSVCKYESNGIKKQINVDAYSPLDTGFFLNIIKNRQDNE